jgi:TonB-linked SusC/RagA family outer membrane protein
MRKLLFNALCLSMAFLLCLNAQAQKRPVTGKVTDSSGAPIPNVSVRLRSTRTGVSTNENGSFQLSASPSDILLISNVGFLNQEVRVGNSNNIVIQLQRSSQALNEVVVTALGIRRSHNSLPYATQQISGSDITKTPSSNFVDNLSGKVAGLQVTSSNTMGGTNNVILRGIKSLTQNNQALFVVDGVPYDNSNQQRSSYDLGNTISDINPDDIESMSVLKGAAASALYGSRGSNGVILITTKKGTKRKGIGVTLNFGVTAGTPDNSTMPQYQLEYGQGYGSQGSANAGNPNPYFYWQPTFNSNGQKVLIVQTDIDQSTGPAYDPSLMAYNWNAFSPGNPNYGKATPWMPAAHHKANDYFETPVSTTTTVSAEGGNDKGTFRMGYTRSVDNGYLPNSNQTKNLLNFGATYNLTDRVTVGGQINYSDVQGIGRYGVGYAGVNQMTDFRQWWVTNVDIKEQKDDYFRTMSNATWNWLGGYTTNVPGNIVKPAYHDNLYWMRYQHNETDSRTRYFGNVNLNYKITSFLNLLARVSMDNWDQLVETRANVGSNGTPSYARTNLAFNETNYDLMLNFDKNLNQDFNLKALLGGNIRQSTNSSISAASNGGLVVPGFYALGNSVNTPSAPTETYQPKEVDGIFAGVTLSYKDMITLDGTIRRDKSSTLPSNSASYYYPAISGNWVFSKVLPDIDWLSYGKLRANYAAVGGDAPLFSLNNTYASATPFNGQTVFSAPTTNNNPLLRPEKNHTYEIGLELSFLRSRIGLDVTYYHAQSIDQIMPVTVSSSSGYTQFYVNGGTLLNKGFEVSLNLVPVKTRDFTWNMTVNWSKNNNKVLSLYAGQPSYIVSSYQNSTQMVAEVGKSWGIFRGTDYTYLNGKKIVDASGNYIKSTNKLSDIGNINPDWLGGVNNSFRYKSFALSFLVDVRQGGDIYSLDMDYGASAGLTPETAGKNDLGNPVRNTLAKGGGIIFDGVTADGKANTVRVDASDINKGLFPFSSPNKMTAKSYMYDASFIKLREIAFTWSMPQRILDRFGFVKGLDVSLTAKNPWIIHKNLPYSDPEQGIAAGSGSSGQNGSMGFQSGAYPVFRTFGFNVKAKF